MSFAASGLDPLALVRSLGLLAASSITPVTGGQDTLIWRVEAGSTTYALRVFRPGEESVCDREVMVMEAAAAGGISVPHVHARGVWEDRSALLLSWLPGRPLAHEVLSRPWRTLAYGVLFGRMQAAIHAVTAPDGLTAASAWLDQLGPEDAPLRQRIRATEQGRSLLHLDYHPLNVMADGEQITGVLDWTNARAGDPRADLARTRTILRLDFGQIGQPAWRRLPLGALVRAFEAGWWRGYQEVAAPVSDLALFHAAAGAFMQRDLAHRYTAEELAHVARWTARWWRRAGAEEARRPQR
jgi:aminoglycoside phosphotransferase (APT) family kinase protein